MSFGELADQALPIQLLQRSLARGRLGHAYLLTGAHLGVLETVARTLAKTVNCLSPRRDEASEAAIDGCDRCESCRKIDAASHPDIQWVRPESKSRIVTIDQIRDLLQIIHLKPTEARYKVGVIVAADRLNVQAANAFLKTLEEPPDRSILILLSTEPQRLLETILSRCLRLNFVGEGGADANAQHESRLRGFAQVAEDPKSGLLGRYRLLDSLLKQLGTMKTQIEESLTARSPLQRYDDVEPKLREKWEDELSAAIEADYRGQRAEVLISIQFWLRDVWLNTLGAPAGLETFPSLAETARAVAKRISTKQATENLRVIDEVVRLLHSNVQEALALEVGLLRLRL